MKRNCLVCSSIIEDGMKFCNECGSKVHWSDEKSFGKDGNPIQIIDQIMMINSKKEAIVNFTFRSISPKEIIALYLSADCFGIAGEPLQSLNDYNYLDLNINLHDVFGTDYVINLPNPNTRKISPYISKVVFEDGELMQFEKEYFQQIELEFVNGNKTIMSKALSTKLDEAIELFYKTTSNKEKLSLFEEIVKIDRQKSNLIIDLLIQTTDLLIINYSNIVQLNPANLHLEVEMNYPNFFIRPSIMDSSYYSLFVEVEVIYKTYAELKELYKSEELDRIYADMNTRTILTIKTLIGYFLSDLVTATPALKSWTRKSIWGHVIERMNMQIAEPVFREGGRLFLSGLNSILALVKDVSLTNDDEQCLQIIELDMKKIAFEIDNRNSALGMLAPNHELGEKLHLEGFLEFSKEVKSFFPNSVFEIYKDPNMKECRRCGALNPKKNCYCERCSADISE
jgi:hypothetical protein